MESRISAHLEQAIRCSQKPTIAVRRNRTWRVINNANIVTRVPPRALGYQHVGLAVHFDEAGQPRIEAGSWNHFLDTLRGPFQDLFAWGGEGLANHSMSKNLSLVLAAELASKHN